MGLGFRAGHSCSCNERRLLYFWVDSMISVILPVLGEAHLINETLEQLVRGNPSDIFEIILADGHPLGTTLSAVTRSGVRKILSPPGRGAQMNAGAARARGTILLFLHADTFLEAGALELIERACGKNQFEAGAFQLAIRSRKPVFRVIEWGVRFRTRLTRIPYGDQAIFISKPLFDRIGGYPEIPIMEDVTLMRRVRKNGNKVALLNAKAFTSARRWETEGVLSCTLRNWMLMLLFGCKVPASILARLYPPHGR